MRRAFNLSLDVAVMDRLGSRAPEVNRSRLVEKLIVEWLVGALGEASAGGAVNATIEPSHGSARPVSPRASEPLNETPLPKVAARKWAQ